MEAWITPALLNGVGVVSVVIFVGVLMFRGHLIAGPIHREALASANAAAAKAEERADRWEAVAIRALDATEKLTEPVVVAAKVMTKLPNVSQEGASS